MMSWCLSCAPPCPFAVYSLCLELVLLLLLLELMVLFFQSQEDFENRLCMLLSFFELRPSMVASLEQRRGQGHGCDVDAEELRQSVQVQCPAKKQLLRDQPFPPRLLTLFSQTPLRFEM